jgi:hypothetical protein
MAGDDSDRQAKILRFAALRAELAAAAPAATETSTLPVGWPALDDTVGGLCLGAINEFSGSLAGGALFFHILLERAQTTGTHLALVDTANTFEPSDWAGALLRRMLWVRCHGVPEALRSVDLLLRDGNLPVVVLDLQAATAAALRRVPGSTWHRFARTLETSGTTLVVLSTRPLAEGVRLRLTDASDWSWTALQEPRRNLRATLRVSVQERGKITRRKTA